MVALSDGEMQTEGIRASVEKGDCDSRRRHFRRLPQSHSELSVPAALPQTLPSSPSSHTTKTKLTNQAVGETEGEVDEGYRRLDCLK